MEEKRQQGENREEDELKQLLAYATENELATLVNLAKLILLREQ